MSALQKRQLKALQNVENALKELSMMKLNLELHGKKTTSVVNVQACLMSAYAMVQKLENEDN